MAKQAYYDHMKTFEQARYEVQNLCHGRWVGCFRGDDLEKLMKMYQSSEGFRIKDRHTKKVVITY